ncbi:hypothetical protein TSUD_41980 [Trifolium subterraneum]|nr:hypothetical protein TSUD_41980 [Trifolium subterraneum]
MLGTLFKQDMISIMFILEAIFISIYVHLVHLEVTNAERLSPSCQPAFWLGGLSLPPTWNRSPGRRSVLSSPVPDQYVYCYEAIIDELEDLVSQQFADITNYSGGRKLTIVSILFIIFLQFYCGTEVH